MATTTRKTPQKSKADLRTRAKEAQQKRDEATAARKRQDQLTYIARRRKSVAEYLEMHLDILIDECDLVYIRPQNAAQQPYEVMAVVGYDGLLLAVRADGFFYLVEERKDRRLIEYELGKWNQAFRDLAGLGAALDARSKQTP